MQVNLFAYPCVAEKAPHFSHCGHASHVTCVRWCGCGTAAVSVGGKDRAVFLWRSVDAEPPAQLPAVVTPWAPDPGQELGLFWKATPADPAEPPAQVHAVECSKPAERNWK